MAKRLYVGNLPYNFSSSDLQQLFAAHGSVQSAEVVIDRMTSQSKGFGFVEMTSADEADAAVRALDGTQQQGRAIRVNEARPREERAGSGGGGGYGGGRGGYGDRSRRD